MTTSEDVASGITPLSHVIANRYLPTDALSTSNGMINWIATDLLLKRPVRVRTYQDARSREATLEAARRAAGCGHRSLIPVLDAVIDNGSVAIISGEPAGEALSARPRTATCSVRQATDTAIAILGAAVTLDVSLVPHAPPDSSSVYGLGSDATLDCASLIGREPGDDAAAVGFMIRGLLAPGTLTAHETSLKSLDPAIPRDLDDAVATAISGGFPDASRFLEALQRSRASARPDHTDLVPETADERGWFSAWMLVPLLLIAATVGVIAVGVVLGGNA